MVASHKTPHPRPLPVGEGERHQGQCRVWKKPTLVREGRGDVASDDTRLRTHVVWCDSDRRQQAGIPRPAILGTKASHRLLGFIGIGQDAVIVQVPCRHFDGDITYE
jgi:hypothetical protein